MYTITVKGLIFTRAVEELDDLETAEFLYLDHCDLVDDKSRKDNIQRTVTLLNGGVPISKYTNQLDHKPKYLNCRCIRCKVVFGE
jgi:G3E family GTPase